MPPPQVQDVCVKGASWRSVIEEASDTAIYLKGGRVEEEATEDVVKLGAQQKLAIERCHLLGGHGGGKTSSFVDILAVDLLAGWRVGVQKGAQLRCKPAREGLLDRDKASVDSREKLRSHSVAERDYLVSHLKRPNHSVLVR